MTSKPRNKAYWKKRADRLFSLFIRQRDADGNGYCKCVTCGALHHWRDMDAGHCFSRRHEATRYNEKNVNVQDKKCNLFDQGKQFEHSMFIDKKYGLGTAEKLNMLSKMSCKRDAYDYQLIGDELLEKLKANNYEIK